MYLVCAQSFYNVAWRYTYVLMPDMTGPGVLSVCYALLAPHSTAELYHNQNLYHFTLPKPSIVVRSVELERSSFLFLLLNTLSKWMNSTSI